MTAIELGFRTRATLRASAAASREFRTEVSASLLSAEMPGATVTEEMSLRGAECQVLGGGDDAEQTGIACQGEGFGILVHGAADQAGGADGGQQDDPPEDLLHDRQGRLAEAQEGLGLLAHLDGGDAERDGDDDDLQGVEAQRHRAALTRLGGEAQDVGGHQPGEEVQPGALGVRRLGGRGGDAGPGPLCSRRRCSGSSPWR